MKRMLLVVMLVFCFFLSGCGGGFGEGAVTGAAVTGAAMGIKEALVQREAELNARYKAVLDKYESAVTETEKQVAQVELQKTKEALEELKKSKVIVDATETAVNNNWTDPQTVGSFSNAAALAFMAWFLRRKEK